MYEIKEMCTVNQQFSLINTLQENERLHVKWKGYSKFKAPDRILKNSKNFLTKGMHKLITLALKIIQAIGRLFCFQSSEKEVKSLKKLVSKAHSICDSIKTTDKPDAKFYIKLNELSKIQTVMTKTIGSEALNKYKETCASGAANLFKGKKEKRQKLANEVQSIIDDLQNSLVPKMNTLVESLENAVFESDKKKVKDAINCYLKGMKKRSKVSEDNNYFTTKALRDVLKGIYGADVTESALKRYKLDEMRAISEKELKIVITGMLANLTLNDLRSIYDNRKNEHLHISKRFKDLEKPFDKLPQEEVCKFMGELLSIVHKDLRVSKKSPHYNQLRHDKVLLKYFRILNYYSPNSTDPKAVSDLKRFGYTEYLSRYVTYALFSDDKANFPDGILIPMYDKKGKLIIKEAHKIVSKNGLHAVAIKPVFVKKGDQADLQVSFRGTYCWNSLMRDLSFYEKDFWYGIEGPGRLSFLRSDKKIIASIENHLAEMYKKTGRKVPIEFMGHSLGSSDALRATESFTNHLLNKSPDRVKSISFFGYNTPSVENDVASRFIENIKQLPFNFKLRYFDADNDPVQAAGKVRLGYRKKGQTLPGNLYASCFRFNRNLDEKIEMMARRAFSKMKIWAKRASNQHTAPFFCSVYHPAKAQKEGRGDLNKTFIDEVTTNHHKDCKIRYGADLKTLAEVADNSDVNLALRTPMWYFARKVKRVRDNTLIFFKLKKPKTKAASNLLI